MRTRKRIRDKIVKEKPEKEIIQNPEDFIDEDYMAALKAIKAHQRGHRKGSKRDCLATEHLSTESDHELRERMTPGKSKDNNTSSNSQLSDHSHSEQREDSDSSQRKSSDKNKLKGAPSYRKNLRLTEKKGKISKEETKERKRDGKAKEKARGHFKEFTSLIMDLNNIKMPDEVLEETLEQKATLPPKSFGEGDLIPAGKSVSVKKVDDGHSEQEPMEARKMRKLVEDDTLVKLDQGQGKEISQENPHPTLNSGFQPMAKNKVPESRPNAESAQPPPVVVRDPMSMGRPRSHLTTLSGYPLKNNQSIHVK